MELFTQSTHFAFQVVQVFLVTTLTSAASSVATQIIKAPLSAKDLLAKNLPKASNFYISYFLLQGLVMSSMVIVQVAGYLLFKFFSVFLHRSPRYLYQKWAQFGGMGWGNIFPIFANLGVIALSYSCIAPLILAFAFVGIYMVYQAYRYNFLFVYDIDIDTKGLVYPRALSHLMTGVYIAQVCLIGLFILRGATGPTVIMCIFLVCNIISQITLSEALSPLHSYLPRSLDTEEETIRSKEEDVESRTLLNDDRPSKWNSIVRWFHPNFYRDYASLRQKIRRDLVEIKYTEEEKRDAYLEPCIRTPPPTLWVPRDQWGVSQQEMRQTVFDSGSVISITDKGAHLDEKNRIVWDKYDPTLPTWDPKILY